MFDWKAVTSGTLAQILGGLTVALIVYVVARIAGRPQGPSSPAGGSRNWITPGPIESAVSALEQRRRKPTGRLTLGWLGAVVALFMMDLAFAPFGAPSITAEFFTGTPASMGFGTLRSAEEELRNSDLEAQEILERAGQDISQLIKKTAEDQKRLLSQGQSDGAQRLGAAATEQAKLIQELARSQAQAHLAEASKRAETIREHAKQLITDYGSPMTSVRELSRQIINWVIRVVVFSGLAAATTYLWFGASPSLNVLPAAIATGAGIAVMSAAGGGAFFELIVPFLAAAMVRVSATGVPLSVSQVFVGACVVIYRFFGRAMALSALQVGLIAVCALVGFGASTFFPGVLKALQMSTDEELGAMIGGLIGFEAGRTYCVIAFLNTMSGQAHPAVTAETDPMRI